MAVKLYIVSCLLLLCGWIQSHELGISTLYSSLHSCGLDIDLQWIVDIVQKAFSLDVPLPFVAAEVVPLSHA